MSDRGGPPAGARPRRRRGWLVAVAVLALIAAASTHSLPGSSAARATGAAAPPALPAGPAAALRVAGPLAVAPDGLLYVADVTAHRVLVREPGGGFRVVAGDGRPGFSGDGGPALHARLSEISDLAFGPGGRLYVADGGRIRVISPGGTIATVAGSGRGGPRVTVADGTPARSADLGSARSIPATGSPLSIALTRGGWLLISTGTQILRLTAAQTLDAVRAVARSGPDHGRLNGIGPLAIAGHGELDVAADYTGWSIWRVSPGGAARELGFARRSGGDRAVLARGPGGAVYAGDGAAILRIRAGRLARWFAFSRRLAGQSFALTYFAFAPNGTLYATDLPGGQGFEAHQQLLAVRAGHVALLWQEPGR